MHTYILVFRGLSFVEHSERVISNHRVRLLVITLFLFFETQKSDKIGGKKRTSYCGENQKYYLNRVKRLCQKEI